MNDGENSLLAGGRPLLLVSVRDVDEAQAALAGGADIIDIKEPARGPLGLADEATIQAIIRAIDGRKPVSVAMGELSSAPHPSALPGGVMYCKIGLAGQAGKDWRNKLEAIRTSMAGACDSGGPAMIAVAYWDAERVHAPSPEEVLDWAITHHPEGLLIDSADKSRPGLLASLVDTPRLASLLSRAREAGLPVALAGRLIGPTFQAAIALSPAIIGVRSAACGQHDRLQAVEKSKVAELARQLARHAPFFSPNGAS